MEARFSPRLNTLMLQNILRGVWGTAPGRMVPAARNPLPSC
jgi:hypothetical protein